MVSQQPTPYSRPEHAAQEIIRLAALMAQLRNPEGGCPWDLEQTPETIAPYAIEEAYEVLDAIQRQDWQAFPDELGDLLLQVVYQSQLAREAGQFDLATVARMVTEKMIRRHPHVTFGPEVLGREPTHVNTATPAQALPAQWEALKEQERRKLVEDGQSGGALAGVPPMLPALLRAAKIAGRAARVGFDWPDVSGVVAKVHEEIDEFTVELEKGDKDRMQDELGDVLFSLASLARRLDLDPEACLRQACDKFTRRFEAVESKLARQGLSMQDRPVEELDKLWQDVKHEQG
ncbi:nucleoside triphosphate pyrophosphohydrolase [Acetobacter cibinongensis]|uniref:Nucleoside triphosphate pyrophosphohydrolase n=1 Tax=Acetobacter cibinongensis TaxID=146475 RepID=A0A0D6N1G4_9PROT|nr:nucleoside triphosphate pyrophosphohydrolase [Acetobacter cibinongensis]GAN59837.1 nucleotide pyrophosphohydrolase MazG [Acetobacter cibinongensis]GBQ14773.1 nucleotide pyrophosphohydrolase MazG [Acetobacter cibinongensis NRIC 0482]GEL59360.1 nucleoside triphosphate pyrophosphohydrolase [Acetobacter cibinongensis]